MHTVKSAANLTRLCHFSPRNELSRLKQFFRTPKLACKQKCPQTLNLPYRCHGTKFISRFHVRTHDKLSCKFPFNLIIAYVTFTHKINTGRSNLFSSTRIDAWFLFINTSKCKIVTFPSDFQHIVFINAFVCAVASAAKSSITIFSPKAFKISIT